MTDPAPKIVREHCNLCLGTKNHLVVYEHRTSWNDGDNDDWGPSVGGGDLWTLFSCCGCETVKVKHESWCSEDTDEEGNMRVSTEYFPPTVTRQKPIWRRHFLPHSSALRQYDSLCDEIYKALAIGAHRIATMGIRALAERLMIAQIGDHGRFEKNVAAFFAAGHVAPNQQAMFKDTLIEAGHAAMHRDFDPSADTVHTLLNIIENIMHSIYYQPMLADQVKKTIPPRK